MNPNSGTTPARAYKYLSDPVHGFVAVPRETILPLIATAEMQRLRRICQLGVGHLIFPCAEHTRFTHALGTMALMQEVLQTLTEKGTPISSEEHAAALAAALLHDVGHSPFSHTLEFLLVHNTPHEAITCALIKRMAKQIGAPLGLALQMLEGTYERPFFRELISGQLDMDRLDYLRRDSHFTGVVEGRIGVERILKTMQVHPVEGGPDARIVIEFKGIYAVENVLIARRLMYWQVYLHKAVVAGDHVLRSALLRARHLIQAGNRHATEGMSPSLRFFLAQELRREDLNRDDVLAAFIRLDDADILYSLKRWSESSDAVLAELSRRFIVRDLFRCVFLETAPEAKEVDEWRGQVADYLRKADINDPDAVEYFLASGYSRHSAYADIEGTVRILNTDGIVRELSESTDTQAIDALTHFVEKPYVCFPKEASLPL